MAAIPCAIVAAAAIVVLGPILGEVLVSPSADPLWPATWWEAQGHPEPVEQGRYVVAVLAPLLLVGAILWGSRHRLALWSPVIRAVTVVSQFALLAFVIVAVLGQRNVIFADALRVLPPIFSPRTLALSALLAGAVLVAFRHKGVADRVSWFVRDSPRRRWIALAIAVTFVAMWMVEGVTTDHLTEDYGQMNWTLNDAFAVLNGRTPLVNYHPLYDKLVPYLASMALSAFGKTALVYTLTMTTLSCLAFLAVFAVFQRITRSSLLSLALFLPFVGMSGVGHTTTLPAMWPMRYGGAWLVAWLTARHVDRSSPRRASVLFVVCGLVAVNNLEFGTGALLATLVALLCAARARTVRTVLRLTGSATAGLLGSVVLLSLLTLLRAGELPNPAVLLEWPRIFSNLGWFSMPMPAVSLHLALYVTFSAAIAVAAVRVAESAEDVLLTSMLAWSGVFGLLAGSYFVGRSDDLKLISMFSAWAFALMLLTVVAVRALAARGWRRPGPAQVLALFGFALAVCSIGGISLLPAQLTRLRQPLPYPTYRAHARVFVGARTKPGETVVILVPEGHRIADDLGLRNVAPYGLQNAIITRGQMQTVIDTAYRDDVHEIFIPRPRSRIGEEGDTAPAQLRMFAQAGFTQRSTADGFVELRRVAGRSSSSARPRVSALRAARRAACARPRRRRCG